MAGSGKGGGCTLVVGCGNGGGCVVEPNTFATICEGVMPNTATEGWGGGSPLDNGKETGGEPWKVGWRGGSRGTAGATGGIKASGTVGGAEGMGAWVENSWEGGVAAASTGLGCAARTDLETSSNQRSASDDERLWEVTAGEEVGGATIPAADDQSLPVGKKFVSSNPQTQSQRGGLVADKGGTGILQVFRTVNNGERWINGSE